MYKKCIKIKFEGTDQEQVRSEKLFLERIMDKIFETSSSFNLKHLTAGKVEFPFSSSFLSVLTKFLFWPENWALGYNCIKF